jgi:hypothetical protein
MTERPPSRTRNLSITGITALTGCVTLTVIAIALITGLWIDSFIGRRGPATICLLVLSIPVSLYLMTRMALTLVGQIQPNVPPQQQRSKKLFYDEKEE